MHKYIFLALCYCMAIFSLTHIVKAQDQQDQTEPLSPEIFNQHVNSTWLQNQKSIIEEINKVMPKNTPKPSSEQGSALESNPTPITPEPTAPAVAPPAKKEPPSSPKTNPIWNSPNPPSSQPSGGGGGDAWKLY